MPEKTRPTRMGGGHANSGLAVDAHGGPVIDPTENVIALTEAANKRQDDLREAAQRREDDLRTAMAKRDDDLRDAITKHCDDDATHLREIMEMRADHQREMLTAEANRLDAIRQVDREEVIKAAASAQQAIQTLSVTSMTTAETLRAQNESKFAAAEARQSMFASEMSKRISAVELSLSEGKGKQTVVDPQLDKLTMVVETLARQQAAGGGKSQGINLAWVVALGLVSLLCGLITIGSFVFISLRPAPQPLYVPSPAGTMLPATPPASVPR